MITLSKTRNGKIVARGTAKITTAPEYKTFDSGKTLTFFYANADVVGRGADRTFDSYSINCWEELSDYARFFEKGDVIKIEGECVKNDYLSKKNNKEEFTINAHTIEPASIGIEVMHLRILVDELKKKIDAISNGGGSKGSTPNEQDVSGMFSDVSLDDLPFAEDVESSI